MRKIAVAAAVVFAVVLSVLLAGCGGTIDGKSATPGSTDDYTPPASLVPPDETGTVGGGGVGSDESSAPSGPSELKIGQSLDITSTPDEDGEAAEGEASLKVTKIFTAKREPVDYGNEPRHGMYLVIRVLAVGTKGAVDFNPFDFYVTSKEGDHFEDPEYSDAWGPSFSSGSVHAGERLRGTIVYDVTPSAKTGAFYYSPNADEEPIGVWRYKARND